MSYSSGPLLYWMTREHRVQDNWSLLLAQDMAKKHRTTLQVVFCLREDLRNHNGTRRWVDFMLAGLQEIEKNLHEHHIPFTFLLGDPLDEIPKLVKKQQIGAVITDFYPLYIYQHWKEKLGQSLPIPLFEVDAHNIVPCWIASSKQEFGAYTIRPKIQRLLKEYVGPFPNMEKQSKHVALSENDWEKIAKSIKVDETIKPVDWIKPGEKAAQKHVEDFLRNKLDSYEAHRNDPTKNAQSHLSPYLHFGHICSQTIALAIHQKKLDNPNVDAFLEELIIRKELSDNFCYYNKNYTNPDGFPTWAQKTLSQHLKDKRQYEYTKDELEQAKTHDPLWNAAQMEMVKRGKMHGYMRMYWAKKILEWTPDPATAQQIAIYLNDTYFLDGRDPNGYTGIAWSIGGVHDRAWFEREIFGKIRFMSYNGAKGKFPVQTYITQYT